MHVDKVREVRTLYILLVNGWSEELQDCRIAGVALQKKISRRVAFMTQDTYNLVPAPRMVAVPWTNSKRKPWSSLLMERIVRQSSVGFGRSKVLDCLSNFPANRAEALVFGKALESRFIG